MQKIPQVYNEVVRAFATTSDSTIAEHLLKLPAIKSAIYGHVARTVNQEISSYCKKDIKSVLRNKGKDDNTLDMFHFSHLERELAEHTPLFLSVVKAAAHNSTQTQNKRKSLDSVKPAVLTACAKVIAIHCEDMNILKQINSIILKKGGLKKTGFIRLAKTYDCMSYTFTNQIFDTFADSAHATINGWKEDVESDSNDPGYTIADDNVDWELGSRHMTAQRQRKSLHKINAIAYKNRVSSVHLRDDGPKADIK
jgi:hypothetical protein